MDVDWSLLGDAPMALAVSGGADSFALMHAVHARGLPIIALTVDHGLREGSSEDARAVAAWCAARGVPHETLRWTGEKPQAGVQAAARAARYRLLCEACERLGLDRLATGHTMDDQAETVFMRLRRGAGRGLAGMPPRRKIASGPDAPVALLRPMLGVRRAEARTYAEAHGLPVRDDPSNEDETFERVRVRAVLGALEEQGLLGAEALARTASAVRDTERRPWPNDQIREGQAWPVEDADGSVTTRVDGEESQGGERVRRREIIRALGGGHVDVEPLRVSEEGTRRTLGGVVAEPLGRSGQLFYREPAALLGRADGTPGLTPVPAPPGSRHLFDRRFVVDVPEDAPPGLVLRPLGQLMPRDVATSTLARARVATLPVLSEGVRIARLPGGAEHAIREALAGWRGEGELLPPTGATFPARSLLAERFANEVIRY